MQGPELLQLYLSFMNTPAFSCWQAAVKACGGGLPGKVIVSGPNQDKVLRHLKATGVWTDSFADLHPLTCAISQLIIMHETGVCWSDSGHAIASDVRALQGSRVRERLSRQGRVCSVCEISRSQSHAATAFHLVS